MVFGNKTLSELVAKVEEREQKIQDHISSLEAQLVNIQSEIDTQLSQLVEFELEGNQEGQTECQKNIRKLKLKMSETQEMADAYKKIVGKALDQKEVQKLREAANREKREKSDQIRAMRDEKDKIQQQINELQKKIELIDQDINRVDTNAEERLLSKIVRLIEPNLKPNIDNSGIIVFIRDFLAGTDVNKHHYFQRSDRIDIQSRM